MAGSFYIEFNSDQGAGFLGVSGWIGNTISSTQFRIRLDFDPNTATNVVCSHNTMVLHSQAVPTNIRFVGDTPTAGFIGTDIVAQAQSATIIPAILDYAKEIFAAHGAVNVGDTGYTGDINGEAFTPAPQGNPLATKVSVSVTGNIILDGGGNLMKGVPAGSPIEQPPSSNAPLNGYGMAFVQDGQKLYRTGGSYTQNAAEVIYLPAHKASRLDSMPVGGMMGGSAYFYNGVLYTQGGIQMGFGFGGLYALDTTANTPTWSTIEAWGVGGCFGFYQAPTNPILEKDGNHYAFTVGTYDISNNTVTLNDSNLRRCIETSVVEWAYNNPEIVAPLPYTGNGGRAFLSAVGISTTEYIAIGGQWYLPTTTGVTNDVVKYSITTNSFTTLAPVPFPLGGHASVLYNGKIYCIGGYSTGFAINDAVLVYNIATDTWSQKASMPINRSHFSIALYDGKIYCVDGYDYEVTNTVIDNSARPMDIYDITTDTWSTQALTGF